MRFVFALLLLALISVTHADAQTVAAVQNWQRLCRETQGMRDAALSRADIAGWTVDDTAPTTTRLNAGSRLVILTDQEIDRTTCVITHPSGGADITAALRTLLENPPNGTRGGWTRWMFDLRNGTLHWLSNSDADQFFAAMAANRIVFVQSATQRGQDVIVYEGPLIPPVTPAP